MIPWLLATFGNLTVSVMLTTLILLTTILIGWQLVMLIEWIMSRRRP